MKKWFIQITLLILLVISVSPLYINAESLQVTSADINIETIPENPAPYSDVTINITSYATDLNKALITWKSGNDTLLSGIGRTKYVFKTGAPNINTAFQISITPAGTFGSVDKSFIIQPSEVEMLWQAIDSYTPPFYKGRSFPSTEGYIRVVAMPNTAGVANINNKNMAYYWKINYNSDQDASGYGKDSFTYKNSYLNDIDHVGVAVSTTNGSYTGTGTVDIPMSKPEIIFYKKSPTEGINYNEAISNTVDMTEDEMTLVAEPYFLNNIINTNDLVYKWQINNKDINTPRNPYELTIRPESRGGYANINISINSISKLFQSVSKSIKINL